MYSDFCKIVRGGTISRILYRLTVPSMRKWPPKSISFILSQTKGLWSANSHLLSRGRSSTRDHKDSKQFSKTRTFLVNVCFSGKKGKLLGKINSLSGIATKTLEGKDKLSLQGQEENSLYLLKHQTPRECLVRKKKIMKWGRKEKQQR